jgi:hypothetical protein
LPEFWKLSGIPPMRVLSTAQSGSQDTEAGAAQVLPVGSVPPFPPAKKPFAVGIS